MSVVVVLAFSARRDLDAHAIVLVYLVIFSDLALLLGRALDSELVTNCFALALRYALSRAVVVVLVHEVACLLAHCALEMHCFASPSPNR